jgi:hypothetical protein
MQRFKCQAFLTRCVVTKSASFSIIVSMQLARALVRKTCTIGPRYAETIRVLRGRRDLCAKAEGCPALDQINEY